MSREIIALLLITTTIMLPHVWSSSYSYNIDIGREFAMQTTSVGSPVDIHFNNNYAVIAFSSSIPVLDLVNNKISVYNITSSYITDLFIVEADIDEDTLYSVVQIPSTREYMFLAINTTTNTTEYVLEANGSIREFLVLEDGIIFFTLNTTIDVLYVDLFDPTTYSVSNIISMPGDVADQPLAISENYTAIASIEEVVLLFGDSVEPLALYPVSNYIDIRGVLSY